MALRGSDPFKVAVATVLSARTQDTRLVPVLEKLFGRIRAPEDIVRLRPSALRRMLRPLGFFRMKAKILRRFARALIREHGGRVPSTMPELVRLPGVGIKVAAIIAIEAYGRNEISVDVHVHRIMNRLGVVATRSPEQTCARLYRILPRRVWRHVNVTLVAFGQTICRPVGPKCAVCPVRDTCPRIGVAAES
jgi:endonuclease-3